MGRNDAGNGRGGDAPDSGPPSYGDSPAAGGGRSAVDDWKHGRPALYGDLIDEVDMEEAMRAPSAIGKVLALRALVDRRMASLDPQERAMYERALDRETKFKLYFHNVGKVLPDDSDAREVFALIQEALVLSGMSFEDFKSREDEIWAGFVDILKRHLVKE